MGGVLRFGDLDRLLLRLLLRRLAQTQRDEPGERGGGQDDDVRHAGQDAEESEDARDRDPRLADAELLRDLAG